MEIHELKARLSGKPDRELIGSLIQTGLHIPATVKAMAYIMLQRVTDEQIVMYQNVALEALEAVEAEDFLELERVLTNAGVAPEFTGIIQTIVRNYGNRDISQV